MINRGLLWCGCWLLMLSSPLVANAWDPMSGHRGGVMGCGVGDTYGGLFGARMAGQIGHHEFGATLGLVGLGAHYRLNIWMLELGAIRLVPTATGGFGPSNYLVILGDSAGFDGPMDYHGLFVQGGGSLCARRFCLNVEYGPHFGLLERTSGGNGSFPEVTVGVDVWTE